jgi:hypothetical protein
MIMSELEPDIERAQRQILAAFGVKPWLVGLAPTPWRIRIWNRITFARWRTHRRLAREEVTT